MSNTGARLKPEPIREVAFGSLTASYVQLGAAITAPLRIVIMTNTTDADVYVSMNGTDNQFRVVAGTFKLLDLKCNDAFFGKDEVFKVKYKTAPTSGDFFIEAMFT